MRNCRSPQLWPQSVSLRAVCLLPTHLSPNEVVVRVHQVKHVAGSFEEFMLMRVEKSSSECDGEGSVVGTTAP